MRFGTALAASGCGAGAQKGPAVARRLSRGFAAQVHQQALAWRPEKGTEDAPFLGGDPAPSWPRTLPSDSAFGRLGSSRLFSRAQSEPLRPFGPPGQRMKVIMRTRQLEAVAKVLRKRKFHWQNPLELETPNLEQSSAKHPIDLGLN
jgi:hypothetical protein